jgi:hypothetical protein
MNGIMRVGLATLALTACGSSGTTASAPAATPAPPPAQAVASPVSVATVCNHVNATLAMIKRQMAPAESGPSGGSMTAIMATVRRDQPAWNAQLTAEAGQAAPGLAAHISALAAGWSSVAASGSLTAILGTARTARAVRTDCP